MPGKNQKKRQEKRIAHARMVWAKKQIIAADFWNAIKDAQATIEANKAEFSDEDWVKIEAQIEEQKQYVHGYLMDARKVFVEAVGEENADVALDFLV